MKKTNPVAIVSTVALHRLVLLVDCANLIQLGGVRVLLLRQCCRDCLAGSVARPRRNTDHFDPAAVIEQSFLRPSIFLGPSIAREIRCRAQARRGRLASP